MSKIKYQNVKEYCVKFMSVNWYKKLLFACQWDNSPSSLLNKVKKMTEVDTKHDYYLGNFAWNLHEDEPMLYNKSYV